MEKYNQGKIYKIINTIDDKIYNEISKYEKSVLLNENTVYKKRSENHVKKVADANRGDKSIFWNYGSVFKRTGKDSEGYCIDSWCFSYYEYINEKKKLSRVQFSIKKFGDDEAKRLATETRYKIYPEAKNAEQDTHIS